MGMPSFPQLPEGFNRGGSPLPLHCRGPAEGAARPVAGLFLAAGTADEGVIESPQGAAIRAGVLSLRIKALRPLDVSTSASGDLPHPLGWHQPVDFV